MRLKHLKHLAICLALAVLLIGCPSGGGDDGDSGNGGDGGNGGNGAITFNLSGNWEGMWQSTVFLEDGGTLLATFTQVGNRISGEVGVTGTPCVSTESVEGTISGNRVVFAVAFGGQTDNEFIGMVFGAFDDAIDGTYSVVDGPCAGDAGTWSLIRVTDSPPEQSEVSFELTCDTVTCPGADDVLSISSEQFDSQSCQWFCATHNGEPDRFVLIDFVRLPDGCWQLQSEAVRDGVCF